MIKLFFFDFCCFAYPPSFTGFIIIFDIKFVLISKVTYRLNRKIKDYDYSVTLALKKELFATYSQPEIILF